MKNAYLTKVKRPAMSPARIAAHTIRYRPFLTSITLWAVLCCGLLWFVLSASVATASPSVTKTARSKSSSQSLKPGSSPASLRNNQPLPKNAAWPGGIAVVPFTAGRTETLPRVYYNKRRVTVIQQKKGWVALVGIPLDAKPGTARLSIKQQQGQGQHQRADGWHSQTFQISGKHYPLRHITIKDKSKVTPSPALARRIQAQSFEAKKILSRFMPAMQVARQFILPLQGRFSSAFGLRRIYNRVRPGRHTGLDIAAPRGTPIVAAAGGRVIASKNFVLTGNTVYVDHGQGIITFYCHMHTVAVRPGENIHQGQMLGTVGATGRVTGPHLHWGLALNGVKVNPLLLVSQHILDAHRTRRAKQYLNHTRQQRIAR